MSPSQLQSPRKTGRPADRQNLIVQEVRDQIVRGQLAPGCRLPTREEIGRAYGAGNHTVQRALDKLRADGFIQSNERGTRVSLEPPHLTRYALVFPDVQDGPTWVRFWTALNQEALEIQRSADNKLSLYYDVSSDPNTPGYQALLAEVLGHSIAGIIFVTFPHRLVGTPLLEEPGIPRIGIMNPTVQPTFPAISLSHDSFHDAAIGELARQGCRRIAFLNAPGITDTSEILVEKVRASGMETFSFWNVIGNVHHPDSARGLMQLLLHAPRDMWPDGLIIGDDNFVPWATQGIVAAGARVPADIRIVAHCNFPWMPASSLPVIWLGFDTREILRTAVSYIDGLRQGRPAPAHTVLTAWLENAARKTASNLPAGEPARIGQVIL